MSEKVQEPKEHKCKICQKVFTFKSNLSQHEKAHKMVKCEKCPQSFTKSNLIRHMRTHRSELPGTSSSAGPSSFNCTICPSTFAKREHLQRHMLVHVKRTTLDYIYQCEHCPFKSNRKESLKCHTKHHLSFYGLTCNFCSYSCRRHREMDIHAQLHNAGNN